MTAVAGDVEGRLGALEWAGLPLASLIGESAATRAQRRRFRPSWSCPYRPGGFDERRNLRRLRAPLGRRPDRRARSGGNRQAAGRRDVERTRGRGGVLRPGVGRRGALRRRGRRVRAAHRLRPGDDLPLSRRRRGRRASARARRPGMRPFLHHRFPASDIPEQARALYVTQPDPGDPRRRTTRRRRSVSRTAIGRASAPRSTSSDCALRSVSPIHLQYLRNMGVAASASVSIVKDGVLWGLVACHNATPRADRLRRPRGVPRAGAATLGTAASRARGRRRVSASACGCAASRTTWSRSLLARGFAGRRDLEPCRRDPPRARRRRRRCPARAGPADERRAVRRTATIRPLAQLGAEARRASRSFATDRLADALSAAATFEGVGAGLLALTLSTSDPWIVMWFRAEQIEMVEWAGNPHKDDPSDPDAILTPRSSFETWRETVRGRSRPWTLAEIEAAARLRTAVIEVWQARGLMRAQPPAGRDHRGEGLAASSRRSF